MGEMECQFEQNKASLEVTRGENTTIKSRSLIHQLYFRDQESIASESKFLLLQTMM